MDKRSFCYVGILHETKEILVQDENGVQWIRTGDLGYITH